MEMKVLVIGHTCYSEDELKQVVSLLRDEYNLKKLPSSEHYLLVYVPDWEEVEIREEMEEISKSHSNPAWEIITRDINNQAELEALPLALYYEPF